MSLIDQMEFVYNTTLESAFDKAPQLFGLSADQTKSHSDTSSDSADKTARVQHRGRRVTSRSIISTNSSMTNGHWVRNVIEFGRAGALPVSLCAGRD